MSLCSSFSAIAQSHALQQLPSYHVARARRELTAAYVRYARDLMALRGRNYTRRCAKAVGIMGLSGAALPSQSDLASSAAIFLAPLPKSITQYRTVYCPSPIGASVPAWGLLAAACVVGGSDGAQEQHVQRGVQPSPTPEAGRPMSAPLTRSEQFLADLVAHGILGTCQLALEAAGARSTQAGRPVLAWGCFIGAQALLFGLEFVRVPLQLGLLAIESLPAIPLGLIGAVIGLSVFLYAPGRDHWPESPCGLAPA